jgi:uncharacterized protein (DUF1810 family)
VVFVAQALLPVRFVRANVARVDRQGCLCHTKTDMTSHYNLQRFVEAQAPVFERVCVELREGRKCSHWMWFIFPQIAGLGRSSMAVKFAIASRQEAEAYLAHEILGPRLRLCTQLVNQVEGRSISEIFGYPDDLKFHSCMTLFSSVTADLQVFMEALHKYFSGELDAHTRGLLRE